MDATKIFLTVNGKRMSLETLLKNPNAATEVDAIGCTGLTALNLPAATAVYARGCTGLTALDLPAATEVDAIGCTGLTGYIFGGTDHRGYVFDSAIIRGRRHIFAGCRNLSVAQALKHWGRGGASDRPDCLALVNKIVSMALEEKL